MPVRTVRGRFLDSAGDPVEGAAVQCIPATGADVLVLVDGGVVVPEPVEAVTDADGEITVDLWPSSAFLDPSGLVYRVRIVTTTRVGGTAVGTRYREVLIDVEDVDQEQAMHDLVVD